MTAARRASTTAGARGGEQAAPGPGPGPTGPASRGRPWGGPPRDGRVRCGCSRRLPLPAARRPGRGWVLRSTTAPTTARATSREARRSRRAARRAAGTRTDGTCGWPSPPTSSGTTVTAATTPSTTPTRNRHRDDEHALEDEDGADPPRRHPEREEDGVLVPTGPAQRGGARGEPDPGEQHRRQRHEEHGRAHPRVDRVGASLAHLLVGDEDGRAVGRLGAARPGRRRRRRTGRPTTPGGRETARAADVGPTPDPVRRGLDGGQVEEDAPPRHLRGGQRVDDRDDRHRQVTHPEGQGDLAAGADPESVGDSRGSRRRGPGGPGRPGRPATGRAGRRTAAARSPRGPGRRRRPAR